MKICEANNCQNTVLAKGLCSNHYYRLKRGKSDINKPSKYERRPAITADGVAKIPLGIEAKQGYAIVDLEYSYLDKYNWMLGVRGYPTTHINRKNVYLHHLIIGKPAFGFIVDHQDRNKLNNQISNLRFTTQQTNAINKGKQSNNKSGYVGVSYLPKRKKWLAQIQHNGKNKFLGHFKTLEEAVAARTVAVEANQHFVEAMNLNKEN